MLFSSAHTDPGFIHAIFFPLSLLEDFLLLLYLGGDPMLVFFLSFGAAESVSFSTAAEDALMLILVKWRC